MKYIFSIQEPHERFLAITLEIEVPQNTETIDLQLPSWRPGRYELGNFAKNIKGFQPYNSSGQPVEFTKITKDRWQLKNVKGAITVHYKYYAAQLDGGACFLDHDQLYVNPVHCCMCVVGSENEKCEVTLQIPDNWKIATGLTHLSPKELRADNFEQLIDSPFIASPNLQHASYVLNGITFNIWLQGMCNPEWPKIIKDFEEFTIVQLEMMKEFPAKDFHFLVQVLPYTFYHGVEHLNSTVLAIGPGYNFMKPALYNDFLGVASHELFHCWNVKSIRPVEMLPYNITGENYAQTGYVYEGVTTYYGDLFLGRSKFFSLQELLDEFSTRLQKHADNPGRFNYSVAESSFDTWLDGYVQGIPGRKTSIYDEGCLLALMLDFMIRSATQSKKSLDQVMQVLYFDYAKKGRGYTGADYREVAELVADRSFKEFFDNYVYKAASYLDLLTEIVSLAGIRVVVTPSLNAHERLLGFRTEQRGSSTLVSSIQPGSGAHLSGLLKEDEVVAVNGVRVDNNLSDLINYFSNETIELTIFSGRRLKTLKIASDKTTYFSNYALVADIEVNHPQLVFRQSWLTN